MNDAFKMMQDIERTLHEMREPLQTNMDILNSLNYSDPFDGLRLALDIGNDLKSSPFENEVFLANNLLKNSFNEYLNLNFSNFKAIELDTNVLKANDYLLQQSNYFSKLNDYVYENLFSEIPKALEDSISLSLKYFDIKANTVLNKTFDSLVNIANSIGSTEDITFTQNTKVSNSIIILDKSQEKISRNYAREMIINLREDIIKDPKIIVQGFAGIIILIITILTFCNSLSDNNDKIIEALLEAENKQIVLEEKRLELDERKTIATEKLAASLDKIAEEESKENEAINKLIDTIEIFFEDVEES